MSAALLEALRLVETIFGSQSNPEQVSRRDRYWTPEELRLLDLLKGKNRSRICTSILRRTPASIDKRSGLKTGASEDAKLTDRDAHLCYQWSQLRNTSTPLQWQWGERPEEDVWSPGTGLHVVLVGSGVLIDEAHKRIVAGAAQIDLIAEAGRRPGVEAVVIDDQPAWQEQVRRGLRTLMKTDRLPNNLLRCPTTVTAPVVLAVGPRGLRPRQYKLLPHGVGVVMVMVQNEALDRDLTEWKRHFDQVRVFPVPRLNASGATCGLTWADLPHLPDHGLVHAVTPEAAVRFAYAYALIHKCLPAPATSEVEALLLGQREVAAGTIVGQLIQRFQEELKQYRHKPRGTLKVDVQDWNDERSTTLPYPIRAR